MTKIIIEGPIELGDEVVDTVTGFKGFVMGISNFLYGCARIGVQKKASKDGTIEGCVWIDEPQLAIVKKKAIVRRETAYTTVPSPTGGPIPSIPTRNSVPNR